MKKLLNILLIFLFMRETSAKAIVVSVEPDTIKAPPPAIGETFRDSIYVSGITASQSLYGCQFAIAYNKAVLRVDSLIAGPFLLSVGSVDFLEQLVDTIIGKVSAAVCFSWPFPDVGAIGSGTVCYIIWQVKSSGDSPLHIPRKGQYFMDTYLLDHYCDEIPFFDTVDGYFNDTTYTPPGIDETFLSQVDRLTLCAYPNPFNQSTVISCQLLVASIRDPASIIQLTIYDLTGRLVKSFSIPNFQFPISNSVVWDGTADNSNRLPSSIYFCKLQAGNNSVTEQLLLLR